MLTFAYVIRVVPHPLDLTSGLEFVSMKAATKKAIGSFVKMATKSLNGYLFTSWRTPDNKHYYLAPANVNLNVERFGVNPDHYEISYVLIGALDMVK